MDRSIDDCLDEACIHDPWPWPLYKLTIVLADPMSSQPTDWIDDDLIYSGPNYAAANYLSFKVISGFMTRFFSVTHLDPQVKLFVQTKQRIQQIYSHR